jgi:hypothetical protein
LDSWHTSMMPSNVTLCRPGANFTSPVKEFWE